MGHLVTFRASGNQARVRYFLTNGETVPIQALTEFVQLFALPRSDQESISRQCHEWSPLRLGSQFFKKNFRNPFNRVHSDIKVAYTGR